MDSFRGQSVVAGEIIVRFRASNAVESRAIAKAAIRSELDIEAPHPVGNSGAVLLRSNRKNVTELLKTFAGRPDVLYAEPNYVFRTEDLPNDQFFGPYQWGLRNTGQSIHETAGADIKAEPAWNITVGSRSVVTAILDTGIAYNHPDLAANVWSAPTAFSVVINGETISCEQGTHGFNAVAGNCDPADDHSHGTRIAGVIGADGNNGLGISGVSREASMMALKFMKADGTGNTVDVIAALDFAIQVKAIFGAAANVRIVNMSFGSETRSQALLDEILLAGASPNNMLFITSAGNERSNNDAVPHYPSNFGAHPDNAPNVIAVTATDSKDKIAGFSNYGDTTVDLGAPGVDLFSTMPPATFGFEPGTSIATSMLSGGAALILSACNLPTPEQLKNVLLDPSSLDSLPTLMQKTRTGGRLNVLKALHTCGAVATAFQITAAQQDISIVDPGASITSTISMTSSNAGSANLAVSAPAGFTASLSSSTLSAGGTVTLTVTAGSSIAPGQYTVVVTGVSGNVTRTTGIAVVVPIPIALGQSVLGSLTETDLPGFRRLAYADVYRLVVPTSTEVTFELLSSQFNAFMELLRGDRTILRQQNGGANGGNVKFNLLLNGTYYIYASSLHDYDTGVYRLVINQPVNDDFANRITLEGNIVTSTSSNVGFSSEFDEPNDTLPGSGTTPSAWWTWTAPCSFSVASLTSFMNTLGSEFDTVLGVFTGSALGAMDLLASNNDEAGMVDITAGTVYQIRVRGLTNASRGSITLHIDAPCKPVVTGLSPNIVGYGAFSLEILGVSLSGATGVSFGGSGITATILESQSTSGRLRISGTVQQSAELGLHPVTVVNPYGSTTFDGLEVTPPPILTALSPNEGAFNNSPVNVTLTGSKLHTVLGLTISGGAATISDVEHVDDTTITLKINFPSNVQPGPRQISANGYGGTSNNLTFTVLPPPPPVLTSLSPNSGVQSTNVTTTLTGENFYPPTTVAISGTGVTIVSTTWNALTSMTVTLAIAADAPAGLRGISVSAFGGGVSHTLPFTVLSHSSRTEAPRLNSIEPATLGQGTTLDVTLTGTNFVSGLTLTGDDLVFSNVKVLDSTTATATLTIAPTASVGPTEVMVTTPAGTSSLPAFDIVEPFPDLSVRSFHDGNFSTGFEERYTITVNNIGSVSTTSPVVVKDSLPTGFSFVSGQGAGWACSAMDQNVTCTHEAVLAASDSAICSITVAVNAAAAARVSHLVSVTADGDLNTRNNSTTESIVVVKPNPAFVFTPYPLRPGEPSTMGVTMTAPFPHDVTGFVDLGFDSNAVIPIDDPAIQFSNGSRRATFRIPANETEARFDSGSLPGPLAFQSGTVAGTLKFTGFLTAGTFEQSFSPLTVDGLTIPLRALAIQNLQTSSQGGFTVSLLLFSTAREVKQLNLLFNTTPRVQLSCGTTAGCSVSGNTLTLDVSPAFAQWFSSDSTFGGLAQLRLPLSIEGVAVKGTVEVTLRNSQGVSNSQSFSLP